MKNIIRLLTLLLCAVVPAYAQTPVPAPTATCVNNGGTGLSNFSVTGSATGFAVAGASSTVPVQAATIADASFQATCHFSIGYETIVVPAFASYSFGMVHYTTTLNHLLGKNLSSKLTFDPTQIYVDFKAGGGKVMQSAINKSSGAFTIGPTLSLPLNSVVTFNVVGAQYVYGHLAGTSGVLVQPNGIMSNMSVSSGLTFSFGNKR